MSIFFHPTNPLDEHIISPFSVEQHGREAKEDKEKTMDPHAERSRLIQEDVEVILPDDTPERYSP